MLEPNYAAVDPALSEMHEVKVPRVTAGDRHMRLIVARSQLVPLGVD